MYGDGGMGGKMKAKKKKSKHIVTCASCGKEFETGDLGQWALIITKQKPACSYECNKALGQVK